MGAEEFNNWVAYLALQDEKYRETLTQKIYLEQQQRLSDLDRANQIRALFSRKQKIGAV